MNGKPDRPNGAGDHPPSAPTPNEKGANRRRKWILIVLVLAGLAVGVYFGYRWLLFRLHYVSSDDARVHGDLVAISPKIPGKIGQILVQEGDRVKQGQVIAELESKEYLTALKQAQSAAKKAHLEIQSERTYLELIRAEIQKRIDEAALSLSQAENNLKVAEQEFAIQQDVVQRELDHARATLQMARAQVEEEQAKEREASRDFDRTKRLFDKGILSQSRMDSAETHLLTARSTWEAARERERSAESMLELARARLRTIEPLREKIHISEKALQKARLDLQLARDERKRIDYQERKIDVLEARAKEAEEAVNIARINLQETLIRSPLNGVVSRKIGNPGEVVQPGQPLLFLNKPGEVWIEANIEETELRKVRLGAPVIVEVDAYPGRTFDGKVSIIGSATTSQFSLIPSSNPSGQFVKVTQRIPVRIRVDDKDHLLKPGMMVVVAIRIQGES